MAEELVTHARMICSSDWPNRKKAKLYVNLKHRDRVYAQHRPGQHVDYLWLDLEHWRRP
jgi:hypothetical protein